MKEEIQKELENHIIPFWDALCDYERGGFYGFESYDLKVDKNAPKGVILHSRILWFYSNCYLALKKKEYLEKAKHCFDFMKEHCVDREYGGVYWMTNADGSVNDSMKHTYCQAFFIYAMSSYYNASGDQEALELALGVFETVEKKCVDSVAYLEAQSREFELIENDALSENGLMADKTMNTVLHLIEAYTELYRVSKNEKALERLIFQLKLTYDKIYDKEGSKLLVFFDKEMNVIGDIHSYGHDIEATWLLDRACGVISGDIGEKYIEGFEELKKNISEMNRKIVQNIAKTAYRDGSILNERENDKINTWRIWWVQAESVVGFLNAYERYNISEYKDISLSVWNYIKEKIIDKREGGEWYSQVDENGAPATFKPAADPWKCPYHNGRMCLEVIARL